MRYSAFEQAAAEASIGVREIDSQLDQLKAQLEQLKTKRDLLETLRRQLDAVRPGTAEAAAPEAPALPEPVASHAAMEADPELAGAAVYTAPRTNGWFTRSNNDSGIRSSLGTR